MDKEDESENVTFREDITREFSETTTVDFEKPDTLVGQSLDGRFLIEKNLTDTGAEEGGFGLVYLATDLKLMGKKVVVKILRETLLEHADLTRKFLHEKEALLRLDHPGIVRILDSGTLLDGNPFMVMEYIEGQSLRKKLQNKKQLPFDFAAHLIESITDALAAAHSKNILHRDVKPENIMLTPQEYGYDRVRLIDFGIARVGDSQLAPATEVSRAIGTVLYIAPEQLIGSPNITPTVDVYASAIVFYEILTGDLSFKPKSIAEMYQLEKDGVLVPPSELRPDLPREAERVIMSALEFQAEKRPQNARIFGQYLANELRKNSEGVTDEFYSSVKTEWAALRDLSIPPDSSHFSVATQVMSEPFDKKKVQWLKWVLIVSLITAGLSISTAFVIWNFSDSNVDQAIQATVPPDSGVQHEFYYSLTVQKMRYGKKFEAPFQSTGREIFETGWKFIINLQPDADGYMYVFNEGKGEMGNTVFSLLFPSPTVNNGSTMVSTGQKIETKQNTFTGGKGTETMWMIWAKDRQDILEATVRSAFLSSDGTFSDTASPVLLQNFLEKYRNVRSESFKDSANQRTVVKSQGDVVVHRFELEHQ